MKFKYYLEEKSLSILLNIIFMLLFYILISPMKIHSIFIFIIYCMWVSVLIGFVFIEFIVEKHNAEKIIELVDKLEEKYYIAEIIENPKNLSNYGYYYALKKACKSMNDKISYLEFQNKQFIDYINMLIHEIKTPVSAISLICKNNSQKQDESLDKVFVTKNRNENKIISEQLNIIENYLEQVLYYTRMGHTEKDYIITDTNLSNIVHSSLLNFRDIILSQKIELEIGELEFQIKTDEKWLVFIINQIIQNSIKYYNKNRKILTIYAENIDNKTVLFIKDNGIGINEVDLPRIFDYGFTGSNRQKKYSTGMGLYICKNLCDKLSITMLVDSKKDEYTIVKIVI